MRLWHEKLIKFLPRQQLLGQHRECCALRGNGWGRKHSTVQYVFSHSPYKLFCYHELIMKEMENRGFKVDILWKEASYRGKKCLAHEGLEKTKKTCPIYDEHDEAYLEECIKNLEDKNIFISSADILNQK